MFMDEDNALIPFSPDPRHCHIVGGRNAITGEQGSAFRVLVAYEKTLSPTQGHTIKDIFTGDNYVGEHPLKKATKMVVSCTLPEKPPPEVPKPPKTEEVLSAYVDFGTRG